jgi:hypothetical protein
VNGIKKKTGFFAGFFVYTNFLISSANLLAISDQCKDSTNLFALVILS